MKGVVILVAIAGALVLISTSAIAYTYRGEEPGSGWPFPGFNGMMGWGSGTPSGYQASSSTTGTAWTPGLNRGAISSVPIGEAIQAMRTSSSDARTNRSDNTITFGSQNASVLVLSMMPDDAFNLTGVRPPSYADGDVFVINGLVDPTLVFRPGSTVHVTLVNLDDDMYHNFVLTTSPPPYAYSVMTGMMEGGVGPGMMQGAPYEFLSMMPVLAPADYQRGTAYSYSYTAVLNGAASLWYVCTYVGHAQSGMYGLIELS